VLINRHLNIGQRLSEKTVEMPDNS